MALAEAALGVPINAANASATATYANSHLEFENKDICRPLDRYWCFPYDLMKALPDKKYMFGFRIFVTRLGEMSQPDFKNNWETSAPANALLGQAFALQHFIDRRQ